MSEKVKRVSKMAALLSSVLFVLGWAALSAISAYSEEAEAGPWISQMKAFEITCGSTATQIRPTVLDGPVHSVRCMMSRETPDDSTDCVCLGGADVNDTTKCYPAGGCSRAIDTTWSVDGNVYCMREDGAADAVIVCLGGTGAL